MAKQIVKKYSMINGDIEEQINKDLEAHPKWTLQPPLNFYPGNRLCFVVYLVEEDAAVIRAPEIPEYPFFPLVNPNPCENCLFYKQYLKDGKPYVGDVPCQWCEHSLYKITCENK